jgi:hypothetical protein
MGVSYNSSIMKSTPYFLIPTLNMEDWYQYTAVFLIPEKMVGKPHDTA